jgi:hypothetical protein
MAVANPSKPNATAFVTPEQWLLQSKKRSVQVVSSSDADLGGQTRDRIPQNGLGHRLILNVKFNVTLAGTNGGTWKGWPNPAPFSLLQRVRFGNNSAVNLLDLSGWNLHRRSVNRTGIDPFNLANDFGATITADIGNLPKKGGDALTNATFDFAMTFIIPLSYNDAGDQGLLVLASNSNFFDLTIDWADPTSGITTAGGSNDLFDAMTSGASNAAVTVNSCTYSVGLEFFDLPSNLNDLGMLRALYMNCYDRQDTTVHAGDNTTILPSDDFYTMVLCELINNEAPVDLATYVSNVQWRHSGVIVDYSDSPITRAIDLAYKHRVAPFDGEFGWDFGMRRGVIGRRDTVDMFNASQVTQTEIKYTLDSGLSLTNPQLNTIVESLRPFR